MHLNLREKRYLVSHFSLGRKIPAPRIIIMFATHQAQISSSPLARPASRLASLINHGSRPPRPRLTIGPLKRQEGWTGRLGRRACGVSPEVCSHIRGWSRESVTKNARTCTYNAPGFGPCAAADERGNCSIDVTGIIQKHTGSFDVSLLRSQLL